MINSICIHVLENLNQTRHCALCHFCFPDTFHALILNGPQTCSDGIFVLVFSDTIVDFDHEVFMDICFVELGQVICIMIIHGFGGGLQEEMMMLRVENGRI